MEKSLTYQQIVDAFTGTLEDKELESVILNEKLKNIFDNASVPAETLVIKGVPQPCAVAGTVCPKCGSKLLDIHGVVGKWTIENQEHPKYDNCYIDEYIQNTQVVLAKFCAECEKQFDAETQKEI